MAGLMSRASTVVKARISKLLDRAEDPSVTLDYSYEKQRELLQDVKRGIADVVTAKKRLQLQATQLEQSVVKLDGQAREAVAAGREDLARQALERKSGVQAQLRGLDGQNVTLTRAEIQEMKAAGASLMPEGLLDAFDEKQVRDLFAYLSITQPLPGKGP